MSSNDKEQDLEELVQYKVNKRVAKKVLRDIHHQVEEIDLEQQKQQKAGRWLIPFIILLVLGVTILVLSPFVLRFISQGLN